MANPPNIQVRGIRTPLPSGSLVGRASPGLGSAEVLTMAQVAALLTGTGTISGGGSTPSETIAYLGFTLQGPFAVAKQFVGAIANVAITLPSASVNSYAYALTVPTANISIYLVNDLAAFNSGGAPNGCLAHIDFTAATHLGTVTWYSGSTLVDANTVLFACFANNNDFDLTLANVILLFAGDV